MLTFMVSNTGTRNVVGVRGMVTLFSAEGVQLSRQEARFWVAENRLPETYLRKGKPARHWPSRSPSCRIDWSAASAGRN